MATVIKQAAASIYIAGKCSCITWRIVWIDPVNNSVSVSQKVIPYVIHVLPVIFAIIPGTLL